MIRSERSLYFLAVNVEFHSLLMCGHLNAFHYGQVFHFADRESMEANSVHIDKVSFTKIVCYFIIQVSNVRLNCQVSICTSSSISDSLCRPDLRFQKTND